MSENKIKNTIINENKYNENSTRKGTRIKGVIFFANNSGAILTDLILDHKYLYDSVEYTENIKQSHLDTFEMNKIGDDFYYVTGEGSDSWDIEFYVPSEKKKIRYIEMQCNISSDDNGVVIIAINPFFKMVIMKSNTGYCK
ncbi:hypothetical protein [Morganella psychrotolerans]|uniref:hypothetical protein n=1 Tax=Morganella psychrotolerans TaxID=368603 RepID=UPI0039AEF8D0